MPFYFHLGQVIPIHINWYHVIAFWVAVAFGPAVYGLVLTVTAAVILRAKRRGFAALCLGAYTVFGAYLLGIIIGAAGIVAGFFTAEWQLGILYLVCIGLGTIVIIGGSIWFWLHPEEQKEYP